MKTLGEEVFRRNHLNLDLEREILAAFQISENVQQFA